tara:strand:- start:26 stop:748 length:723 start_codon:yes stop_codon:yes gene_type:complete
VNKNQRTKSKNIFFLFLTFILTTSFTIKTFKKVNENNLMISGTKLISRQSILNNSSLNLPKRLIFIKTKSIEKELLTKLALKNISINRQLIPFGLKIRIETRKPIAYCEKKVNDKLIKGYVDIEGYFIPNEFAEKNIDTQKIKVTGWDKKYQTLISKILKFYYQNNYDLELIKISPDGFINLNEKRLKKITLGDQNDFIDLQLDLIKEIKNQLGSNKIIEIFETVDLSNPSYPKIKVFKP